MCLAAPRFTSDCLPHACDKDAVLSENFIRRYRAINPRRVVPTLVLGDGTTIGEVPAIMRYLDEAFLEGGALSLPTDVSSSQPGS
jgi:glutathione S-transferase